MALTVVTSGTANPVVGTNLTLVTETPAQPTSYVLRLDTSAMAAGDTTQILLSTQCLAGGAYQVEENVWIDGGANAAPMQLTTPTPVDVAMQIVLLQSAGTARAYPWKLFSL